MPISLKIYGNPESNAGFQPLVLINNASFKVEDTNYGTGSEFSYFYTIRIEDSQTVYTLVKNRVHSYGAAREGVLKIAIAIPAGNGLTMTTPVDVLQEVYRTFVEKYMSVQHAEREEYEFKPGRVNDEDFKTLVDKFPLKENALPHRVMEGKGYAVCVVPPSLLSTFMQDVQYKEFGPYGEILIVPEGTATPSLVSLPIPRTTVYTVQSIIDSVKKERVVTDINEILVFKTTKDERAYTNVSVSFSIAQLLAGTYISGVKLDQRNDFVTCVLTPQPKTLSYKLVAVDEISGQLLSIYAGNMRLTYVNAVKTIRHTLDGYFIDLCGEENLQLQSVCPTLDNAKDLGIIMPKMIRRGLLFEIQLKKNTIVTPPTSTPKQSKLQLILPYRCKDCEIQVLIDEKKQDCSVEVRNQSTIVNITLSDKLVNKTCYVQVNIKGYQLINKKCEIQTGITTINFNSKDLVPNYKRWLIPGIASAIVLLVGIIGLLFWQGILIIPTPSKSNKLSVELCSDSISLNNVYQTTSPENKELKLSIFTKDTCWIEFSRTKKSIDFEISPIKSIYCLRDTTIVINIKYLKTNVGTASDGLTIKCWDNFQHRIDSTIVIIGKTEKTRDQVAKEQKKQRLAEYKTFTSQRLNKLQESSASFNDLKQAIADFEKKESNSEYQDWRKHNDSYMNFDKRVEVTKAAISAYEGGYEAIGKFVDDRYVKDSNDHRPAYLLAQYWEALLAVYPRGADKVVCAKARAKFEEKCAGKCSSFEDLTNKMK